MKAVHYYPQAELQQEEGAEHPGVGRGEAVVLVDGAAAPAEGDDGHQEAQEDEEHGDGDQGVAQEVKMLLVRHLDAIICLMIEKLAESGYFVSFLIGSDFILSLPESQPRRR